MISKIKTQKQYQQIVTIIENYIDKATLNGGFSTLSKAENKELEQLSKIVAEYEDYSLKIMPLPVTINNMIEQKIVEQKITRAKLAKKLGFDAPKLSQILNGKRPPDVAFLKAAHLKLGIDASFLLENA
jgi:HTH-type transcriptional regulator / antitoxin HigA